MDCSHTPAGFKQLTLENWLEPDEASQAFVEIDCATGERRSVSAHLWADRFLTAELSPMVPNAIRDMWSVACSIFLYAWFFYPLYALGG